MRREVFLVARQKSAGPSLPARKCTENPKRRGWMTKKPSHIRNSKREVEILEQRTVQKHAENSPGPRPEFMAAKCKPYFSFSFLRFISRSAQKKILFISRSDQKKEK
jgi:hypothetical protein